MQREVGEAHWPEDLRHALRQPQAPISVRVVDLRQSMQRAVGEAHRAADLRHVLRQLQALIPVVVGDIGQPVGPRPLVSFDKLCSYMDENLKMLGETVKSNLSGVDPRRTIILNNVYDRGLDIACQKVRFRKALETIDKVFAKVGLDDESLNDTNKVEKFKQDAVTACMAAPVSTEELDRDTNYQEFLGILYDLRGWKLPNEPPQQSTLPAKR